jgi:hypothetical protein
MPDDLVSHLPRPLLDDLVEGRSIPIIGAGFSANAVTPDGSELPQWQKLGELLAADVPSLQYESPIDAISAYEQEYGRAELVERLRVLLKLGQAQPGSVHEAFCALGFERVITTNFDLLLEQSYQLAEKPCFPITDEQQLASINPYPGPLLLKLHGDLHHPDRLVVTEDDYDSFLRTHPLISTYLAASLINHTAVLIGYSLDDPDMRQILGLVRERLGSLKRLMWAILVGANDSLVSRYERRGVKVINLPAKRGQSYGEALQRLFEGLRVVWGDRVIAESQPLDERALAELKLPPEAGRICYFAVPLSLLSWYREILFPVAEQSGFVPVAPRDVLTPPGTAAAKIDALIDRASVMVADLSTANAAYELALARARLAPERLIVILREGAAVPTILAGGSVIRIAEDPIKSAEVLRRELSKRLESFRNEIAPWENEPQRLLDAGEYRAAVVSAMSHLEFELSRRLFPEGAMKDRPFGLRSLLNLAVERGILQSEGAATLEDYNTLRNRIVHSQAAVRKQDAEKIVTAVIKVLRKMSQG